MSENSAPELSYQPATKGYSFKAPESSLPENPENEKPEKELKPSKLNPYFLLVLEVSTLIIVFIVFLLILNFFKIISLQSILPQKISQAGIFTSTFSSQNNLLTAKGTLYGYNEHIIQIKVGLLVDKFVWQENSQFYYADTKAANTTPGFLSDFEKPQNIGKQVLVQYGKDKQGNNIIYSLNLIK